MTTAPGKTRRLPAQDPATRVPGPRPRLSRRGHTLAELMLVLAILVLFAGIVAPKVANSIMRAKLDSAFDAVRTDLVYTRDRAVGTGIRHQFVLDPSSLDIVVQAYHPEEQMGATPTSTANNSQQADLPLKDHLSSEIRVARWEIAPLGSDPSRPTTQFGQQGGATPLVFYPEGNGDSATLVLEDEAGRQRGLQVNGFTGEIRELSPEELK